MVRVPRFKLYAELLANSEAAVVGESTNEQILLASSPRQHMLTRLSLFHHSGHRQKPLSHATSTPDRAVIASPSWPLPLPEPRSAVLTEARTADGRGQLMRGLLGRFLIEFNFAAG